MRWLVLAALALAAAVATACSADRETLQPGQGGSCAQAVDRAAPRLSGGSDVGAIARDVERLRRLRFRSLPRPRYLTGRAFDRRVARSLDDYPDAEAAADGRALVALGALPRGTSLKAVLQRALSAAAVGFYDPRSEVLVVDAGADRRLGAIDRVVLAHELEHALVDQRLALPDVQHPPEGREDAATAAVALAEGDAELVTEVYAANTLSPGDAIGSLGPALDSQRQLASLPHFIEASLVFPYVEGSRFVCTLYRRGGWRAVDRAYRALPRSTAEILFPERYRAARGPVDPPDPPSPGRSWRRIDRGTFGAADLLWLLEAPGNDEARALGDLRDRVRAWNGGELYTWVRGNRTSLALTLVERRGERSLCETMRQWRAAARLGTARVRCGGGYVRVVVRSSPS